VIITDHFSGPGRVIGRVCVRLCFCLSTPFELNVLMTFDLFGKLVHLDTSRSSFKVKVVGQSSLLREEIVAIVVGATSRV